MRTLKTLAATIVAGVCFVGSFSIADDKKPADAAAGGMDPKMMEAWMKASTPGEQHKHLAQMVGQFKYVSKWRMDPKAPWDESQGTYDGEMILGGRFLAYNVSGPMMGETFEGMGCLGYDNIQGKYVSGWIDNMTTSMMYMMGSGSADGKTITLEGDMPDMMNPGKTCHHKIVYTIKSNDEFTMQMWAPPQGGGDMFECMNITYTRAK
jgi:hypothetical protein